MNTAFDRGEVIGQRDLLDRFSYDCLWRAEAHGKRGVSACGVYLPDLDRDRSKCLIRPRTGLQIARHGAGSWQVLASDRATTPVAISLTPGVYASSCFVTIGTYPASRPLGGVTMSFGSHLYQVYDPRRLCDVVVADGPIFVEQFDAGLQFALLFWS